MTNDTTNPPYTQKTCIRCLLEKPLSEFHRLSESRDGYRPICKACRKIYEPKNILFTPEPNRVKECKRCKKTLPATLEFFFVAGMYRDGLAIYCKDCTREKKGQLKRNFSRKGVPHGAIRCIVCLSVLPAISENFHKDKSKPDGFCSVCKKCNGAKTKRWGIRNREKVNAKSRLYYKNNPRAKATKRISWQRYKARKNSLPNTWTIDQWSYCLEYFHYRCAVCESQLRDLFGNVEPHADHWIALTDPRPDNPGTVAGNMICLCSDCNLSKSNKDAKRWLIGKFGKKKASEIIEKVIDYFQKALVTQIEKELK